MRRLRKLCSKLPLTQPPGRPSSDSRREFFGSIAGVIASLVLPQSAQAKGASAESMPVLDALRAGGLIIFFRHGLTMRTGQPDNDLSSCANQRNLTEAGRQLAKDVGAAFVDLKIPVGKVKSSPYCRCKDTAALAFGRVEVVDFLATSGDPRDPMEQARIAELAQVLSMPQPAGANTVLVAHGNNLRGLASLHGYPEMHIDETEAVIFRPGAGSASVVARVKAEDWRRLGKE